jgi:hypothetical protein
MNAKVAGQQSRKLGFWGNEWVFSRDSWQEDRPNEEIDGAAKNADRMNPRSEHSPWRPLSAPTGGSTMTEQELLEALKAGAVILVNQITGEHRVAAHDDLPADMRECIRVSRAVERIPRNNMGVLDTSTSEAQAILKEERQHRAKCPDCIEADADATLMDAESWREEGNETNARELEAEAEQLQLKAARMRTARLTERT